jgi:S-formylglutathione hydrolase FrmB
VRGVVRLSAAVLAAFAAVTACGHAVTAHGRPSATRRDPARGIRPATHRSTPHELPPTVSTRLGTLERRTISGAADDFVARPAYIYVPTIARRLAAHRLPVLVLLHGTPGGPDNWPTSGRILTTADAFAAAHHGLAPVIVMPDINGTHRGDTECIRTPSGGDVEQYLQVTVHDWVVTHIPAADPDGRHWAVAGLSEGGTCAAMLALTRPSGWAAFADLSGLGQLTLGRYDSPLTARRVLFGGSQAQFDLHDPPWLLAHRRFDGMAALFESGSRETAIRAQQASLAGAAERAGIRTRLVVDEGPHEWAVWSRAFQRALPWLWAQTV